MDRQSKSQSVSTWTDVLAAAGNKTQLRENDGLEFHHLTIRDTATFTRALQKNLKHLETYLPPLVAERQVSVLHTRAWIESLLQEKFPSQHFVFTHHGDLCGFGSTLPISADPTEVQLRYMVFQGFTGKGIATRIAKTLELYAFGVWGFHRIHIEMDSQNLPSVRVANKLGYRFLGTREYGISGTKSSGFWYSFVKERPPEQSPAVLQGKDPGVFT